MIDHESAFGAVLKTTPSLGSLDLDRFYDHVFYSVLSPSDADYTSLKEALGRLSAERIESFLGEIPTQWHIKEDLAKVRDHLNWVVAHRDQVCDLIRERLS